MNTTPEQIAVLAAQLTEKDIAAIIRAKTPTHVSGREVESIWFHATRYFGTDGISCSVFAGDENDSGGSLEVAARNLATRIKTPAQIAAAKRAEAERLIAEAEKMEGRA